MKMNNTTLSGVRPGKGFKEALYAPVEMKAYITNESRLEHGTRYYVTPKKNSRNLTLEFQIIGSSTSDFKTKYEALLTELYKGTVKLEPTEISSDVFNLIYTGKSPACSMGLSGRACKISVGFVEYNPNVRTGQ